MSEQEDELTTLAVLSAESGIPVSTLQRAAQLGSLKAHKLGRDWVTTRRAFREWMETRKMGRPKKNS